MHVKRLGKAIPEWQNELWGVEGRVEKFHMNLRVISGRREVKAAQAIYSKISSKGRPTLKKPNKRKDYIAEVAAIKKQLDETLEQAYEKTMEDSFLYPILLWKDRDWGHKFDWRFVLYRGMIFQLDRSGYEDRQIREAIHALMGDVPENSGSGK